MEVFTPLSVTRPCECGGKSAHTPSIRAKHQNTMKHTTWEFQQLCLTLLKAETRDERVKCLLRMRDLVRTGRVK